jgi:nucleotidyltransferase substrate binding protein (TIGR01987 family)
MDRLAKKYDHLNRAIAIFNQAFLQHTKWKTTLNPQKVEGLGIDYEGIVLNLRDSMIQRFEYSIDLLWKYIKSYLYEKLTITPDVVSPNTIIREAGKARLISEEETKILLDMIKKRNLTSHIYQEEIAELLSGELPTFLEIMQKVSANIAP